MRLAVDGDPVHAKFQPRCDFRQRRRGAFAAGQAVGDQADMVAAVGLAVGDVEDMAKNAANRRAHGVQDPQRLVRSIRHVRTGFPKRACFRHSYQAHRGEGQAPQLGRGRIEQAENGRSSIPIKGRHG